MWRDTVKPCKHWCSLSNHPIPPASISIHWLFLAQTSVYYNRSKMTILQLQDPFQGYCFLFDSKEESFTLLYLSPCGPIDSYFIWFYCPYLLKELKYLRLPKWQFNFWDNNGFQAHLVPSLPQPWNQSSPFISFMKPFKRVYILTFNTKPKDILAFWIYSLLLLAVLMRKKY